MRPEPYRVFKSNIVAFILAPKITNITPSTIVRGNDLNIQFNPPVAAEQKVFLLLNSSEIGNYTFPIPSPPLGSAAVDNLSINTSDFPIGEFLVRLQIDGAQSMPEIDQDPQITP